MQLRHHILFLKYDLRTHDDFICEIGISWTVKGYKETRHSMENGILVLSSNRKQCLGICAVLDEQNYQATPIFSEKNLVKFINESHCGVLILDLDSITADKTLFRRLKRSKPSLCIVGLSSRAFHPELEEAMSNHIYACLSKPVDEDELVYWIKSLF